PRPDRIRTHLAAGHVARVNRRKGSGEVRQEGRLRSFELKSNLVIAVRFDLLKVPVPGLARILAPACLPLPGDGVPGTFHILARERLAVVPCDTVSQLECESRPVFTPRPCPGEVRDDGIRPVLL